MRVIDGRAASGTVTADFTLDTLGRIEGRVVDAATGEPVDGFESGGFAGWSLVLGN